MKKTFAMILLALAPLAVGAKDNPYLFDFVQGKETGSAYKKLIEKQNLPSWVNGGGTSTPASEVTIDGTQYLALSGCKPHNCPSESIAILYSKDKGDIHGVYSAYDSATHRQTLTWMNVDPINSPKMINILFSTLNGEASD